MCIYITLREINLVATRESTRYNEVAQNKPSHQITPFSTTLTRLKLKREHQKSVDCGISTSLFGLLAIIAIRRNRQSPTEDNE